MFWLLICTIFYFLDPILRPIMYVYSNSGKVPPVTKLLRILSVKFWSFRLSSPCGIKSGEKFNEIILYTHVTFLNKKKHFRIHFEFLKGKVTNYITFYCILLMHKTQAKTPNERKHFSKNMANFRTFLLREHYVECTIIGFCLWPKQSIPILIKYIEYWLKATKSICVENCQNVVL